MLSGIPSGGGIGGLALFSKPLLHCQRVRSAAGDIPCSSKLLANAGLTLTETIVALVILLLVLGSVLAVFAAAANIGKRNQIRADEAASLEEAIANNDATKTVESDINLRLNGYELPSKAVTYEEDSRSYTLIESLDALLQPYVLISFGDGAGTVGGGETGPNGQSRTFVVPAKGVYLLEVWGARGGGSVFNGINRGGYGGYASGKASLEKGTTLYLYAGGQGERYAPLGQTQFFAGPFGGGGSVATRGDLPGDYGTTGGGASDIRIGGRSLYHRLLVAGGGGGAGLRNIADYARGGYIPGGFGGGVQAGDGSNTGGFTYYLYGLGASQLAPGGLSSGRNDGYQGYIAKAGTFGVGGDGAGSFVGGGGGGGGWYGGGGGDVNSGGGGSGWAFTADAFNAWNASEKAQYALDDYGSIYHLSDESLVAGNAQMPDPLDPNFDPTNPAASTTMTGNSRGGFVRISYLGP